MGADQVYVITRDNHVQGVYSSLDMANDSARELFADVEDEPTEKKHPDGSISLTGDFEAKVTAWQVQAEAKGAKSNKATAKEKKVAAPKKATPKPSKESGPTKDAPKGADNCLSGKTFLVTGTIEGFTRPQIQDVIKEFGGRVVSAISAQIDIVVLGEGAGPKKLGQIEELGLETIDYAGLQELIETSPAGEKRAADGDGETRKSKRGKTAA